MACENCGTNYKGNCNCKDPITLVATGPAGATGPQGPAGTTGVSLIDSIITTYPVTLIGTGNTEVIYSKLIDNTPTQQFPTNGDFMVVRGRVRSYFAGDNFRVLNLNVYINAILVLNNYRINAPAYTYTYCDFEVYIKRMNVTTIAYYSKIFESQGTVWATGNMSTSILATTNVMNFATDSTVSVEVSRYNLTSGGYGVLENFTSAENGRLQEFVIEKYLL